MFRSASSARSDTAFVPVPASGTDTTMARPCATTLLVTGGRIAPPAAALACSAATACRIARLATPQPATTTSRRGGAARKGLLDLVQVRTTGRPGGRSMAGFWVFIASAGQASASSAAAARPPHSAAGAPPGSPRRSIAGMGGPWSWPCPGPDPAPVRPGAEQREQRGSTVSAPATATPTTAIVPNANPVNSSMPVRNSPAMQIITVRPETTIAQPDVAAAVRRACAKVAPAARSSRSLRR